MEFTSIVSSQEVDSGTHEGRWISAREYREYGMRDAIRLGVVPYTNPEALDTVATAYAVPGHTLFAKADDEERRALLDSLLNGSIGAVRHSDDSFVPVSPEDDAWEDIVRLVRTEAWDPATHWSWQDGELVGSAEQSPVEHDLLLFVVQDEHGEGGTRVIDWEADSDLQHVVFAEYADAFYDSLAETARALNCPFSE